MASTTTTNGKYQGSKEFATPEKVHGLCETMQNVEILRAQERTRVNALMNGLKPYTKAEVEKYNIEFNVNFNEGKRIMMDAQRQLNNALLHTGILFNCSLQDGPKDKSDEWSLKFTKNIHVPIQNGRSGKRYNFTIRARNNTICVHGIGPLLWQNDFRWMPRYVPIEDLLIPTDTFCDFSNMRYFAANMYLSPGEFKDMTKGDKVTGGWNQEQVDKILAAQKDMYTETLSSTWRYQPEEVRQIRDQNYGYNWNDILPKIKLRAFYWMDLDKPGIWYKHVIQRENYGDAHIDKWVYEGNGKPFANNIDHILNVQYGDGNIIAPLKYHSVRGLGIDLFAPVELMNRLRCELMWSTFENMKMLFYAKDPADRDRIKQVVLQQFGFIPEGLEIVPNTQRHQIDPRLVEFAMSQTRQIMQESSSSFVRDVDNGTQKEMTAFEANTRLNQANVMVSGMLGLLYLQEGFLYQEIVRRFRNPMSADAEVKEFQRKCLEQGIPEKYLFKGEWKVTPERVLGGGDKSLGDQQAAWLFQNRTAYGPESQQTILRMVTAQITNDAGKAQLLVPSTPETSTRGTEAAESLFPMLMLGNQVGIRKGIDIQGYIAKMLQSMGNIIKQIESTTNMGTMEQLIGLQTVAQNISQYIAIIAEDPAQKELTKQFSDALGNMMNMVKGFVQRLMESQQQQQPQVDPAQMAKAESIQMLAQLKAKITQENNDLKQRHKDMAFHLDEQRKNLQAIGEIDRQNIQHHQDLLNQAAQNTLDLMHTARKAKASEKDSSESD